MSNQNNRLERNGARRSQITRQLLMQYIVTFLGFVAGFTLVVLLAWQFCGLFTWQPYDPLYIFLSAIQRNMLFWGGGILLVGWSIITYRFIQKPLRYLDEIIAASEALAKPTDELIMLPDTMKNVQDELNLVREQALRNAMAVKEAEKRKNDLVVYLAHDLKTPLTSVIGYLTLLRDEPQISKDLRAKYTGIALDKAERLEDLINEFFDITRFSLSQLTLEPENVNLTRMLEQITFEFNPVLAEKELLWEIHLAPNVEVICDSDKLERVFDNLIRNAVNYSYKGTNILISLQQGHGHVTVRVSNHGKTIPSDKLGRIFEQFFRLDSSRTSSTGGAGLGLAIAKEIVELHGGTITAKSADESITFTVTLPMDCQKIV